MVPLVLAVALSPVAYAATKSTSNWINQNFLFSWNNESLPFPIPTTRQCDTIKIRWSRGGATGSDPVAPYTLQILTSNYIVPFYVDAGSSLSFDYAIPFAPGTQYQICMYDSKGQTGGCQATYTVIDGSASCTNVTFPGLLEVEALTSIGQLSQYGWPNQCTDISVTPKAGTPPFVFTAAPALHPPVNITSNSMQAINWTIDLSWGSPFFITLADSTGLKWSYGPLHSGGDGSTGCLTSGPGRALFPVATTVGSVVGAFVGGIVLALFAFLYFYRGKRAQLQILDMGGSSGDIHAIPYMGTHAGFHSSCSALATADDAQHKHTGSRQLMRAPSRSSRDAEGSGHSIVGYSSEPFNHSANVQSPDMQRGQESAVGTHMHSPPQPTSPDETLGRDVHSQVYVVHHDGGRAPVTILTSDGAEVVELPPGYVAASDAGHQRPAVEPGARGNKHELNR